MHRALAVLLIPAAAAAQVVSFSAPERVSETPPRVCVDLESTRVCRTADAEGGGRVEVEGAGWDGAAWAAPALGAASDVRAFRVPLGDGRRVLVVAVLEAVSNGLGVATWRMAVVPEGADAPAYTFVARDVGPEGGSFATWRGRPVVWATEWLGADDPSGRRGPGTYFVGRPFVLRAEGLEAATALPIRARRLLRPFRHEPGGPVGWLSSRAAQTWRGDPAGVEAPRGPAGRIVTTADADDGYLVTWTRGGATTELSSR